MTLSSPTIYGLPPSLNPIQSWEMSQVDRLEQYLDDNYFNPATTGFSTEEGNFYAYGPVAIDVATIVPGGMEVGIKNIPRIAGAGEELLAKLMNRLRSEKPPVLETPKPNIANGNQVCNNLGADELPAGFAGPGAARAGGADFTQRLPSLIKNDPGLIRAAEEAGASVQMSLNNLEIRLARGNMNPGIGSKHLFGDIFEARARDGARLYFRQTGGTIEIVGKSTKANQSKVISILQRMYASQ
jgi:hypothetical protein